ncbi:MAG TPA: plastocyanin/azurin family copper-binding protein [Candidatus Binatus sp.]|jgi:plastocyanin|nr:plastocyanin/azurin family copper-binding protein [Candidatus Binatus sp.]
MRRQLIALALPVITGALLVLAGTAALAGGGGCFQPDTQGAGTVVNITARCFSPTILYVQPGDKVTWRNDDGMTHVVAGSFSGWGNPTNLAVGESMTHHFPTAGIYAYSCPLHYGMNAVVIVGDGKATVPLARIQPAATISTSPAHPGSDPWPLLALAAVVLGAGVGYRVGRLRRS